MVFILQYVYLVDDKIILCKDKDNLFKYFYAKVLFSTAKVPF